MWNKKIHFVLRFRQGKDILIFWGVNKRPKRIPHQVGM